MIQWRRAQDLTNLGYPQEPGSILAKNPSLKLKWILANRISSKGSKLLFPMTKANEQNNRVMLNIAPMCQGKVQRY